MDDLNSQVGRLSMTATEWLPTTAPNSNSNYRSSSSGSSSTNPISTTSDLNAASVKEFVPGKGWSVVPASNSNSTHDSNSSNNNVPMAASAYIQQQQQEQQNITTQQLANHALKSNEMVDAGLGLDAHNYETFQIATEPSGPTPAPPFRALHSLGVSDDLWRYHRDLSMECMRQMDPSDPRHKAVPPPYCNAFCLDTAATPQHRGGGRSSFGYPSNTFQVTSREDGHLYCLRRFDNVRSVSPKIAAAVQDRWTASGPAVLDEHPGIVQLYQCFVAQRAVFFVHQFVPGARTLKDRLLVTGVGLPETLLWSCIVQLVSAVRAVHGNNLAVRSLDLQHILSNTDSTNSRLRLRLNCLGIVDALEFEARKHVLDLQREDIRDLGRVILSLATGTEIKAGMEKDTLGRCEAFLAQNFSRDLHNLTMTLIRVQYPPTILDVSRAVAHRCFEEQDDIYRALDRTDRALSAEYESGRALRLLLKLGFVNERPEFGPNRRWSQSGDCYVLTLFRDFVFHQADGAGNPVMDLGHVITTLNKLDAADEEKIVLSSRDGKSLMVVSYADVARCLEHAFHELCSGSVPPSALQY